MRETFAVVVIVAVGGRRPVARQEFRALLAADGRSQQGGRPEAGRPARAGRRGGGGAARRRAARGHGRPPPRAAKFVDRLFVSGTLVAREEAEVSARIDGVTIVEIDAEDGDVVKAGQVLARIDSTQLDAHARENDDATARADAAIAQARNR